jgi:hypothetical protein
MFKYLFYLPMLLVAACTSHENNNVGLAQVGAADSLSADSLQTAWVYKVDDSLNTMAGLIGGTVKNSRIYSHTIKSKAYTDYSAAFSKRWQVFDSVRVKQLAAFRDNALMDLQKVKTIFYPFSGPDCLYPGVFFPEAETYVLLGLEPVGTLPHFESGHEDSLSKYFSRLNGSLYAILNFSFFRTESMSKDLKNNEVDGVLHLLFLFLNRTSNELIAAKPLSLDTAGQIVYQTSFEQLKQERLPVKGIEIKFLNEEKQVKTLYYFSANAADPYLTANRGLLAFLNTLPECNTYLKGASYLLHKPQFSIVRNIILKKSVSVAQDDSGIALKYFLKDENSVWSFKSFGQYTRPIPMFANHFQPALDSLFKANITTELEFGIGYNYKGKKSNFMVAAKKQNI